MAGDDAKQAGDLASLSVAEVQESEALIRLQVKRNSWKFPCSLSEIVGMSHGIAVQVVMTADSD